MHHVSSAFLISRDERSIARSGAAHLALISIVTQMLKYFDMAKYSVGNTSEWMLIWRNQKIG